MNLFQSGKTIIVDFTDALDRLWYNLDTLNVPAFLDQRELIEHHLDSLIIGQLYDSMSTDPLKDIMVISKIPFEYYTTIREEFRANILQKIERVLGPTVDRESFTINWVESKTAVEITVVDLNEFRFSPDEDLPPVNTIFDEV